jgi:hypothetical protein
MEQESIMQCFKPIKGYRQTDGSLSFQRNGKTTELMEVSCGRCIGCRLRRANDWAVRCYHESMDYAANSFITLTYNDDHLPQAGTLVPDHHKDFMKRFRRKLEYNHDKKIRFYMCGEYGDEKSRPHYHYLIFGWNFAKDRYEWKKINGVQYYRSDLLEECWQCGNSLVGELSMGACAYVAKYILKKQTGRDSEIHYMSTMPGYEGTIIEPEFTRMSLKPGIGANWAQDYGSSDIYDTGDNIVIDGVKYRTPQYYDKIYGEIDERALEIVKKERVAKALENEDNTPSRMAAKEQSAVLKTRRHMESRSYEAQNLRNP